MFSNIKAETFPLLIKMIDAYDKLSVQVHPDDEMAKQFNSLGKTECWYILDAVENAEIIYGHNAMSKDEFKALLQLGKYDQLLNKIPVKKGDFYFIPAGVVHAIGAGILILEIQQSSDITYRLFDYERIEKDGSKRELHLDLGLNTTKFPSVTLSNQFTLKTVNSNEIITLTENEYFNVYKWNLTTSFKVTNYPFSLITFIKGAGTINGQNYKLGDSVFVPSTINNIEKPELVIVGSLGNTDGYFKTKLHQTLKDMIPNIKITEPKIDPAYAAARLALYHYNGLCFSFVKNLSQIVEG